MQNLLLPTANCRLLQLSALTANCILSEPAFKATLHWLWLWLQAASLKNDIEYLIMSDVPINEWLGRTALLPNLHDL